MVILKQIRLRKRVTVGVTSADRDSLFLVKTEARGCLTARGYRNAACGLHTTTRYSGDPTHAAQEVKGNPFSDKDTSYTSCDMYNFISFVDRVSVTV